MAGIQESVDLDISAALKKVGELEAAVNRAGKVNVQVETAGLTNAAGAIRGVTGEVSKAGVEAEKLAGASGIAQRGVKDLASTFSGSLGPGAAQASGLIQGLGGELSSVAGGPMAIAAAAAVGLGVVLGKMALDGVKDFVSLAGEVRKVANVSGATAEEASGLVAVMKAVGVEADSGAAAFFRLARNVASHASTLEADGIEIIRNKQGHVDLIETLFSVADAYQKAGSGAEGDKILFDAFGRSGAALIPILKLSHDQLEEFYKAAEKHHQILSQDDLDMARSYQVATRELGEAWTGLERELGANLIPAITDLAVTMTHWIETVDNAVNSVNDLLGPVGGLGNVAKTLVTTFNPLAIAANAVSGAHKALKGDFLGAIETGTPLGHLLTGLFGGHKSAAQAAEEHAAEVRVLEANYTSMSSTTGVTVGRLKQLAEEMGVDLLNATTAEKDKLQQAAEKLNAAITPTQHLAQNTKVLGNEFSTTAELVKAFKDDLDAALGSYLDVDDANIKLRQAIAGVAEEVAKGQQKNESYGQYQDRVRESTISLVKAVEAQEQAMVKSGQLSADAASQNEYLGQALLAVANVAAPAVRDQILGYIRDLNLVVPTAAAASTATLDVNTAPALLKLAGVLDTVHLVFDAFGQVAGGTKDITNAFGLPAGSVGINQSDLDSITSRAHAAGDAAQKAFNEAMGGANAVRDASNAGTRVGAAAASAAAAKVKESLLHSGSQGLDIGGFIIDSTVFGIQHGTPDVVNAALAMATGVADVTNRVKLLDPSQQADVLKALEAVEKASKDLGDTRKELGADSIEAKEAEFALSDAQKKFNDTLRAGTSDVSRYLAALDKQKQAQSDLVTSLGKVRSAYADVNTVARAQRDLLQAERDRNDLLTRQAQLPAEIAKAQSDLAASQQADAKVTAREDLAVVQARKNVIDATTKLATVTADSTATDLDKQEASDQLAVAQDDLATALRDTTAASNETQNAAQKLKDLQDEQTKIAGQLRDATDKVTDSQNSLIDAQLKLIETGQDLSALTPQMEAFFRAIATAAGLSSDAIDKMVGSLRKAGDTATGANRNAFNGGNAGPVFAGNGQVSLSRDTLIPLPGGGTVSAGFLADRGALQMDSGGRPLVDVNSSILLPNGAPVSAGAVAVNTTAPTSYLSTPQDPYGIGRAIADHPELFSGAPRIQATFQPLTANFDEQAVNTYLRALELAQP